jgi:hypothetical protein
MITGTCIYFAFLRLSGAEILLDVGGRLLHGLSHRFRRLERLVSHTLGQESILAHSSLGGEPQGTVVRYFSDQVPVLLYSSFETCVTISTLIKWLFQIYLTCPSFKLLLMQNLKCYNRLGGAPYEAV